MSKAKMMYAFDHIPTGMSTNGGNVGTYSDFPFTFTGANGSGAGTLSDSGGTWLGFSAVGAAGNFWTGTWKLPVSVFDYTKPHSFIGFRFKAATTNRVANPLVLYDSTTTRQAILVAVGDQTWNQNQEYYIEVLIDRTNKQRTVWVDGSLVINAASYGSYTSVSTDQLGFCEPVATGSSTAATYQYKDIYVMDDPGDGSVARLGPIIAKPITLASSASGAGWTPSAGTIASALNTAVNTSTPSTPNVTSATDGTTPMVAALQSTADAGSTVQGVLIVAGGSRNVSTSSTLRATLTDQTTPTPNQVALTPTMFPTGTFAYGRTLGFLANALDGNAWSATKVNQLTLSALVTPT
jgi:hypothetical protein